MGTKESSRTRERADDRGSGSRLGLIADGSGIGKSERPEAEEKRSGTQENKKGASCLDFGVWILRFPEPITPHLVSHIAPRLPPTPPYKD